LHRGIAPTVIGNEISKPHLLWLSTIKVRKDSSARVRESFKSVEPKSVHLRKYISHYYFHQSDNPETHLSFSYYPHYRNALTIYRNSKVELIAGTHTKAISNSKVYSFTYSQLFKNFGKAEIIGPFDKIGVVFQPLGLNHFVSAPLAKLISGEINIDFNYFKDSISPVLDRIFTTKDESAKVELLDQYFLNQITELKELRLPEIIAFLFETVEKISVRELCDVFNINRKTLLRLFKKHLNCSPKDYLTLIQFRRAVESYQNSSHKPSLTRLALDLDYYDQSDFIHRFTKITGVNPKRLFTNIEKYGVHSTYWTID
jgi:AraC-like DNA-binding protein